MSMTRLPLSIACLVGSSVFACGGAVVTDPDGSGSTRPPVDRQPAGVAPGGTPTVAPGVPPPDYTIQPATTAEALKQCDTPPKDWEDTLNPARSTYATFRWVMCKPRWVMLFIADDRMVVEGFPNSVWDWGLVLPAEKVMVMPFPITPDGSGFGIARGVPQRARGGLEHWLRLPVNPEESGALAPLLHGQTEAIFVRVSTRP